jgi:Ni/Fe-hydrogenase 1 B-type cytochrome subunit
MTPTSRNIQHESRGRSKRPKRGLVRVYVWEWPVRFTHWIIFLAIILLSVTGYYMHSPFVISRGRTAYVMGTMRFVHLLTAFVFLAAVLVRLYWLFAGNRWARWNQFIPVSRKRWRELVHTVKYYTFFAWRPSPVIGHNALAGATYAVVFGMEVVQVLTGLALFTFIRGSGILTFFFGWLPWWIDIQWLREIHFLLMFGFWVFFLHHIFSAILYSTKEKNALLGSMFAGYKFVPEEQLNSEMYDWEGDDTKAKLSAAASAAAKTQG